MESKKRTGARGRVSAQSVEAPTGLKKAEVSHAREIHELLEEFADKGLLLPRSLWDIYSHIRDFTIWHENGVVLGVCALHIVWENLAEIRSFCVKEEHQRRGIGGRLLEACMKEAKELGVKRIFVLTYLPDFFERRGFERVEKHDLPQKVWADCIHCAKFPDCDEIALIRDI